jgi:hypothetical protein
MTKARIRGRMIPTPIVAAKLDTPVFAVLVLGWRAAGRLVPSPERRKRNNYSAAGGGDLCGAFIALVLLARRHYHAR